MRLARVCVCVVVATVCAVRLSARWFVWCLRLCCLCVCCVCVVRHKMKLEEGRREEDCFQGSPPEQRWFQGGRSLGTQLLGCRRLRRHRERCQPSAGHCIGKAASRKASSSALQVDEGVTARGNNRGLWGWRSLPSPPDVVGMCLSLTTCCTVVLYVLSPSVHRSDWADGGGCLARQNNSRRKST